jgi:hypothetical protein
VVVVSCATTFSASFAVATANIKVNISNVSVARTSRFAVLSDIFIFS